MKHVFIVMLLLVAMVTNGQTVYENGNIAEDTMSLDEISVNGSFTAVKTTPFTFQNLTPEDISFRTVGDEPGVLLSYTPSVNYYSDNGLGLGYGYYRIRGIDQTRINSTLNGIPLNEPEDQGIYYNNYVNLLQSVSSIQIIRGAGLSKPGVSSYGGSINFNSLEFSDSITGYATAGIGSYGTMQFSAGVNTKHFFINGSYSTTDGHKYNSFNKSYSTFYGATWKNLTLYGYIGKQRNGMAWLGEPLDSIHKDPRYNSNKPSETDDFLEFHNQLKWDIGSGFSAVIYHTYLKGWYDMDIAHFDPSLEFGDLMYRLNLKSNRFGTLLNYNLRAKNWLNLNTGISAYTYYRDHEGLYNMEQAYNNTGYRNEVAPYAKAEFKVSKFAFYGDIQYRYTTFSYNGLEEFDPMSWSFLNWSGGTSYNWDRNNVYFGIGRTNREPTRTDLFGGNDDYDPEMYNPVSPETALSNELGYKYFGDYFKLNANLYYMNFKNEIVLNGQVGPNGIMLHQNAAESFRSGMEIDGTYVFNSGFEIKLISSFAYNQITQDGEKLQPVLSSPMILVADVLYRLNKTLYVGLNTRYNSKSYIDFSNEHTLGSYSMYNAYAGVNWKGLELRGMLNNLGNEIILANALIPYEGASPSYFAMAGINGTISLTYKF